MIGRVLLLALPLVAAAPLGAQQGLQLRASALAYFVEWNARAEGSAGPLPDNAREVQTWIGGQAQAAFKVVSVAVRGLSGVLDNPLGQGEVSVRLTTLSLRLRPVEWLSLGVEGEALRSDDNGVVSLWRLYGGGAGATAGLGIEGLVGRADIVFLPGGQALAGEPLGDVGRLEVGMTYEPQRFPLRFDVAYAIQAGEFPSSQRFEGFRGVLVGAGLRLGK
jgi:hypothetical protein